MKENKTLAILDFIPSFCFYGCAIINFMHGDKSGIIYLCLGTTYLCSGIFRLKKDKEEKK